MLCGFRTVTVRHMTHHHTANCGATPHCTYACSRVARSATRGQAATRGLAIGFALASALLAGCSTAPGEPASAISFAVVGAVPGDAACLHTATLPAPPRALRMAAAARQELALWGNAMIDAEGRLTQSGAYEAEDRPRSGPDAQAPWQRVLGYWRGVDPQSDSLPYVVRYGAWRPANRGQLQAELARTAATGATGTQTGWDENASALSAATAEALRVALDRVAVVDTPWSAAFISWLARQAGLREAEFDFSEAHADYARAAYYTRARESAGVPGGRNVLRACPLANTSPRVGDLVCHARGRAARIDSFDALGAALTENGLGSASVPMHCDIVVALDDAGFDAIGGNVLQAVTQRRLAFAPGSRLLNPGYQPAACQDAPGTCRHLSQQPWSLLLQWR